MLATLGPVKWFRGSVNSCAYADATAFYYDGTEPVWAQGAVDGTPTGNFGNPCLRLAVRRKCPTEC